MVKQLLIGGTVLGVLIFLFGKKAYKMINNEIVIRSLNPSIQEPVRNFVQDAYNNGISLKVYSGYRSFAEQQKIYNQGRTTEGPIVTNALPGQSWHNYGLAVDVVEIKDGKALWENPNWERIGQIGERNGFEWGGRWTSFKDKPHFQKRFGMTTAVAMEMQKAQKTDLIRVV